MEAVVDDHAGALAFVFARRYGFEIDKQIVQPSRAGQSGFVGSIEQAARIRQLLLGMFDGQVLDETLGADAGPATEDPLKMGGTQVQTSRCLIQTGLRR